ncbi:MAG: erythromycin esterase family protein [Bacteriovorax sp.]|nr:erythromycin esterase family protein [Bacteriovorax sp.]
MNTSELDYLNQQTLSVEKDFDLAPLLTKIKDCKLVCMGDASHGTHEFYEWRMKISLELIRNHGFQFVSFEGDWPDFEGINKYLLSEAGESKKSINDLLKENFARWPQWMWANQEMKEFINEVRLHNLSVTPDRRVKFHGLDLYSIQKSAKQIPVLLEELDPIIAKLTSNRLIDIDFAENTLKLINKIPRPETERKQWLLLSAKQNAKAVLNGLRFKKSSGIDDDRPWNIRDRHMMDTLTSLFNHYGEKARGIVWAHINHVSDIRRVGGMSTISLGGLAKDALGDEAVSLIAFMTYSGKVTASSKWDGSVKTMNVPPAIPGSMESALNLVSLKRNAKNLLLLFEKFDKQGPISRPLMYHFVAVVYNPNFDQQENYVYGSLPNRFDALFFIDKTRALEPLDKLQNELDIKLQDESSDLESI